MLDTGFLPATGILSTLGDLAKYTSRYEDHKLITAANYARVTTPQTLNVGSKSPYGIGWFTEEFEGKRIHWHYSHADAYASLLVWVQEIGYTFIFLSNSSALSEHFGWVPDLSGNRLLQLLLLSSFSSLKKIKGTSIETKTSSTFRGYMGNLMS
ncbi:hypothetical protein [Pedobacter sp. R-06]|uniref:hypothetical protein n=1 Tax=Pedobacter sp. R-06 TaxID=3404051 RepID=UPI003CEE42E2